MRKATIVKGSSWNRKLAGCFVVALAACSYRAEPASQSVHPQIGGTDAKKDAMRKVTPLLAAVGRADVNLVQRLLESGAIPDDPAASRSPLVQAISTLQTGNRPALSCNVPIVRELLKHGANPNLADPEISALPLQTAFDVGSVECVQLLLNAGAMIGLSESDGRTALMAAVGAAARLGDTKLLDEALRLGVDVNERTKNGWTALHEAVRVQSVTVVKYLLAKRADACMRNDIGQTPLQMAMNLNRDPQLIKLLSERSDCQ